MKKFMFVVFSLSLLSLSAFATKELKAPTKEAKKEVRTPASTPE